MLFQATPFVVICYSLSRKLVDRFNHEVDSNSIRNGGDPKGVAPGGTWQEELGFFWDSPVNDVGLERSHEGTLDTPEFRIFYRITVVFKNIKVMKAKQTEETAHVVLQWVLLLLGHCWDNRPNLNGAQGVGGSNAWVFVSAFRAVFSCYRRISCW